MRCDAMRWTRTACVCAERANRTARHKLSSRGEAGDRNERREQNATQRIASWTTGAEHQQTSAQRETERGVNAVQTEFERSNTRLHFTRVQYGRESGDSTRHVDCRADNSTLQIQKVQRALMNAGQDERAEQQSTESQVGKKQRKHSSRELTAAQYSVIL